MDKTAVWILLILFVAVGFLYWNLPKIMERSAAPKNNLPEQSTSTGPVAGGQLQTKTFKIGGAILNVGIADTEAKQQQGLSGKLGLPPNEGLLFVFDKPGYYGFWMKDMNFPIDIAWFDKDKRLIYLDSNVPPSSYPDILVPDTPSLYVLETNANFFIDHGIKIGDAAEF